MTPIKISIPTATPDELRRGVEAAMAVFRQARIEPLVAAKGRFAREAWDMSGFDDEVITADQYEAASVWDKAETAAVEAPALHGTRSVDRHLPTWKSSSIPRRNSPTERRRSQPYAAWPGNASGPDKMANAS
ncbi:hypothetical protein RB623_21450 [Mesorhizobium sp. LHD-90]|uniref:hypothetical protein n=1 Tax=Mesorhizobium sp. LHD-90 TaxID=3071414 RepID=UPI0027E17D88|nr:hypothetical protein [Mesorhizobium sp. LHD-90]MDQ6436623.1 hypothetical protein [Mesorhizobium sp. LHD-90]